MPHTRKGSFHPKPLSFSQKMFCDVGNTSIIAKQDSHKTSVLKIRFCNKNFARSRIFLWKKYNASQFEWKILQHVRFKKLEKLQIFNLKFKNVSNLKTKKNNTSVFELKILHCVRFWVEKFFQHVWFWKKFCFRKRRFWFHSFRGNNMFGFFRVFSWSMISQSTFHTVWFFELKNVQLVRFWIHFLKTCQIWIEFFFLVSFW